MDRKLRQHGAGGRILGRGGPKAKRPRPGRLAPVWMAILAAGTVVLFLVLSAGSPVDMQAPTLTPGPAIRATPTAPRGVVNTVTPSSDSSRFTLAVWANVRGYWQVGDLRAEASGYREGQAIPLPLRIDSAKPGGVYTVRLRYDCGADRAAAGRTM